MRPVLFLATLTLAACWTPVDPLVETPDSLSQGVPVGIRFSTLLHGDSIMVWYKSIGCFHEEQAHLVVRATGGGAQLTGTLYVPGLPHWPQTMPVGPAYLSSSDLRRLDRMIALFRGQPRQMVCTGSIMIQLAKRSETGTEAVEHYSGDGCVGWEHVPGPGNTWELRWPSDALQISEMLRPARNALLAARR